MSSLTFEKESVSEQQTPQASLLSSSLTGLGSQRATSPQATHGSYSTYPATNAQVNHSRIETKPTFDGYTAQQVVKCCLRMASKEGLREISQNTDDYEVRVGNDDGSVDTDFPELDLNVPITSVGVTQFVLCRTGTEQPVLRIALPEKQIRHHACESDSDLSVTCYSCDSNRNYAFSVKLSSTNME
eukprot:gb/GECG01011458.1/.p1 GENE.gb/GECG01011458.1/~~gb/GECG01011458.1/.p1  ORF type:complete len:186 (+),score=14.36 gb/GECG01011458.1/:1-558(+)